MKLAHCPELWPPSPRGLYPGPVRVKERPWVPCIDILLLLIMIIDKVITKYSNETKVVTISQYFLIYTTAWTREVVLITHYQPFCSDFYQQSRDHSSQQRGGWGQKMSIFADLQYYLCWRRWVDLEIQKTCWRNTLMVTYQKTVNNNSCSSSFWGFFIFNAKFLRMLLQISTLHQIIIIYCLLHTGCIGF